MNSLPAGLNLFLGYHADGDPSLDNTGGRVFTGVGTFGRIKQFAWDDVATVRESISGTSYPGSQGSVILLEGKSGMVRALKSILANVKKTNRLQ
jgi:hypothetical protein